MERRQEVVVMLVTNDVATDARVRKSALAVAATGADVTVIGLASDGRRSDVSMGPVRITRVPVEFVLRDDARARLEARRRRGLLGLRPLSTERETVLRFRDVARLRDLDPAAAPGRIDSARQQARRARRLVGRLGALGARALWGGLERTTGRIPIGARWRRVLPEVDDIELAYGPVIDALQPDVIHAHDVQTLPIAARAAMRARARGLSLLWIYDAHEWVVGLSRYPGRSARKIAAWADLEREYIRSADRVITVSPTLATALQERYSLPRRPDVVLNIPPGSGVRPDVGLLELSDVRTAAGLDTDTPLMVYSGGVTEARGVADVVAALRHLPEVHLAVVAVPGPEAPGVRRLLKEAEDLGVSGRVHALDPVAPDQVVGFLRTADVGLIPLHHFGSHEFALANKLFEYLHAGVPMVVSDCRAQAQFVTEHRLGLVHRAGDTPNLAQQVKQILGTPAVWRSRLAAVAGQPEFTWAKQAQALQAVYAELSEGALQIQPEDRMAGLDPGEQPFLERRPRRTQLGIGPSNSAGQAWAWSRAVVRQWPEVQTEVVAILNGTYDYPADVQVRPTIYRRDPVWGLDLREHARATWTHALIETGRPIFGGLAGADPRRDIAFLQDAGIEVGLVFHGSEVRSPRQHAATHAFSPFRNPRDPYTRRLQEVADRNAELVRGFGGPVFVSTPDQLDDLPDATWLPVCIDLEAWPLVEREETVPLVVHAPSNPVLKGTDAVERAVEPLVAEGLIRYQRVSGLQPKQAAELIRTADIVVDQLLLGLYGVLACEALASGAIVLGNVGDRLRSRVPAEVPIIEATPSSLNGELRRVLRELPELRASAAGRRAFVQHFHSGCYSADVLGDFLGLGDATSQ
ncbi:hypothetical protein N864_06400 [Intrasporangium chromatireducens Q5-1]|uniref:Glycosyltransferase subfamily 4-like N-terminal domain-containing protein n=1 Tax=Intrasporangium chromatireducens Q5-1 TaxID=584657 RepID=W9GR73_9MICO|nr:glycosyltransferase [Intrasporangium chromatireducens]EWT07532.1 hypothetical protein N864_06400 [Intrasporangium chromatireducens Q5-1]